MSSGLSPPSFDASMWPYKNSRQLSSNVEVTNLISSCQKLFCGGVCMIKQLKKKTALNCIE